MQHKCQDILHNHNQQEHPRRSLRIHRNCRQHSFSKLLFLPNGLEHLPTIWRAHSIMGLSVPTGRKSPTHPLSLIPHVDDRETIHHKHHQQPSISSQIPSLSSKGNAEPLVPRHRLPSRSCHRLTQLSRTFIIIERQISLVLFFSNRPHGTRRSPPSFEVAPAPLFISSRGRQISHLLSLSKKNMVVTVRGFPVLGCPCATGSMSQPGHLLPLHSITQKIREVKGHKVAASLE